VRVASGQMAVRVRGASTRVSSTLSLSTEIQAHGCLRGDSSRTSEASLCTAMLRGRRTRKSKPRGHAERDHMLAERAASQSQG
jgi:hypothetical protein